MDVLRKNYTAYLLRVWQRKDNQTRIILQNVHTGEQELFSSIEELSAFLTNNHREENGTDAVPSNR